MTLEATQRIANASRDLPDELEPQVISYIIKLGKENERPKKSHKAKGALKKYADPTKWPLEEGAFERAVVENYASD